MTCTEEYKEHIVYTFHAFCRVVIRNSMHYSFGTKDEYFKALEL